MNKALQYQALLYIRKEIQKKLTHDFDTFFSPGLCEMFFGYCNKSKALLYYTTSTCFLSQYTKFINAFCIRYPEFLNKSYRLGNQYYPIGDLSVGEAYKRIGEVALVNGFWWNRNEEGYRRRLKFIELMIQYYNPRNKRTLPEIIKQNKQKNKSKWDVLTDKNVVL